MPSVSAPVLVLLAVLFESNVLTNVLQNGTVSVHGSIVWILKGLNPKRWNIPSTQWAFSFSVDFKSSYSWLSTCRTCHCAVHQSVTAICSSLTWDYFQWGALYWVYEYAVKLVSYFPHSICRLCICSHVIYLIFLEESASSHWIKWRTWKSSPLSIEWKKA